MNIPQDTLQAVADAAFEYIKAYGALKTGAEHRGYQWQCQEDCRSAVIQHALDNPALAPYLGGGPVHPASAQLAEALESLLARDESNTCQHEETHRGGAIWTICDHCGMQWADDRGGFKPFEEPKEWLAARAALKAFSAAPFLAGGIGEYTEEEIKAAAMDTFSTHGIVINSSWFRAFLAALPRRESPALAQAIARAEKAEAELASIKSAQLGILHPLSEMPETVPDGCIKIGVLLRGNGYVINPIMHCPTHFAILRLPDAEAPPPVAYTYPQPEWVDAPEPAAQVPLGPEDVKPGSVLKALSWREYEWRSVSHVYSEGVLLDNCPTTHYWIELEANWQINTSIPDTGRWDANAWRPCSKPAGKEVAK